jgi:hypothetical protein
MGIKVLKDFQKGDSVVVRLEFDGPINLTGNTFNITLTASLTATPAYDTNFSANSNLHADDNLVGGIINLVMNTTTIPVGVYLYSITRTASGAITTIARTGLNSVDSVECKQQL